MWRMDEGKQVDFFPDATQSWAAEQHPAQHRDLLRQLRDPVGARNSATLGDLRVFVDHSAESVTSNDLGVGVSGWGSVLVVVMLGRGICVVGG
jgi:hypothetical protein